MSGGRIWLGLPGHEELLVDINRSFVEEDFEPRRVEQRTASGRLVRDIGPMKKRFELSYNITTDLALEQLKRLYQAGRAASLSLRVEQSNASVIQYSVVFSPFSRARHLLAGQWFWEDIDIVLEEV